MPDRNVLALHAFFMFLPVQQPFFDAIPCPTPYVCRISTRSCGDVAREPSTRAARIARSRLPFKPLKPQSIASDHRQFSPHLIHLETNTRPGDEASPVSKQQT